MNGPSGQPPGSRPGRRALFSGPYDPGLATGGGEDSEPGGAAAQHPARGQVEPAPGRRALFSEADHRIRRPVGVGPAHHGADIHPGPTTAVIECRTCLNRTPMSVVGLGMSLLPSLWLPRRPWPRLMRCPACQRVSWCRVEWPRLRGSD